MTRPTAALTALLMIACAPKPEEKGLNGERYVEAPRIEDYTHPRPRAEVLNFVDSFTVARLPDGTCDWSKVPVREGKHGTSSYLGERHPSTCSGVVYNITDPPQNNTGMKVDTVVKRSQ